MTTKKLRMIFVVSFLLLSTAILLACKSTKDSSCDAYGKIKKESKPETK